MRAAKKRNENEDVTIKDLIEEGINMVLEKRHQKPLA